MNRHLVLIGMRGAGKSTIGLLVAKRLSVPLVDLDREVERRLGLSIREIFEQVGEAAFRAEEARLLAEVLQGPVCVVATGGGAVLSASTRDRLRGCHTAWLQASADVLAQRIAGSDRPSLTGAPLADEIATVLASREALYAEVAKVVVRTDECDPEAAADTLAAFVARQTRMGKT